MKPVYIYALRDPRSLLIRYIGKSIRPRERVSNHLQDRSVTYRTNWLRSLRTKKLRPLLEILEEVAQDCDWRERERWWIAEAKRLGWPLTNCTSGGDGVPDLPPEIRAKISATWIGRKHKPSTRAKIGAASRKRRHSEEHKKKMSEKFKGREFSPEWRSKISSGVSKLNDDQISEIRRLLSERVSQYTIADKFGVHQGTISNIKRGLFYRDKAA